MDEHGKRAAQAAGRAKQMSESVQYAIVQVLPNIVNGAFWGFTDMDGIKKHLSAIKNAEGKIVARQLGNSCCLIEVEPNFLINAVAQIDPNAVTRADVRNMSSKRIEAEISLEKFLISRGKTKPGEAPFRGAVGIYCTNDVKVINYKGVAYPAFRVDMMKALRLFNMYGYNVQVGGNFINATQAANAGQALWSSVSLSPTKTGLFINIASTFTPERIKALEKEFKERVRLQ